MLTVFCLVCYEYQIEWCCCCCCCLSQKVAHMTKSEMHLHDVAFLGPGLLFLNQYFNSFIDEYVVLWIALVRNRFQLAKTWNSVNAVQCLMKGVRVCCVLQVLSLFDLVRYCVSVCNQIASHLHIFIFKIKPVAAQ